MHPEQENILLSDFTGEDGRSFHAEIALTQADPLIVKALEQGEALTIDDIDVWQEGQVKHRNSKDFHAQEVKFRLIIPLKLGVKIIGVLDLECAD
ncbi:MAG: hypothetical protein B6243_10725, partial [Anaerolineaceae bacterium 4572_5.2]